MIAVGNILNQFTLQLGFDSIRQAILVSDEETLNTAIGSRSWYGLHIRTVADNQRVFYLFSMNLRKCDRNFSYADDIRKIQFANLRGLCHE